MQNTKRQRNHLVPFGLGAASASMSYVIVSQLTYCLTDSYAMSAVLVGTIFLVSRIFDGITDVLAGFIIDKTHTKWGKARPFDLFCIPLWLILILCFNVPEFQTAGKVVWVFLTYNLCQSVCYTFVTVSQTVRVRRSFQEDVRSKALAVAGIVSAVCSTVAGILCPMLIALGNAFKYLFKVNVVGLAVCACASSIGITLAQCMRDLLVIDCMKYGQWKSKNNLEGVYASIKGFSDKIALGIGSLIIGFVLQLGGYDGALEQQTEAAKGAIQFGFAGLPALLGILGVVCIIFYRLDSRLKEIGQ
jgi:Na+/melibiose symporter-like transporter